VESYQHWNKLEGESEVFKVAFTKLQNSLETNCSWLVDLGTTKYVVGSKKSLDFIDSLKGKRKLVAIVGGEKHKIEGVGEMLTCIQKNK